MQVLPRLDAGTSGTKPNASIQWQIRATVAIDIFSFVSAREERLTTESSE